MYILIFKSSQPEGSYVQDLLCVLIPHLHEYSRTVLGKPHQVSGNPHFTGSPPTLLAYLSPHRWLLLANKTKVPDSFLPALSPKRSQSQVSEKQTLRVPIYCVRCQIHISKISLGYLVDISDLTGINRNLNFPFLKVAFD